MILKKGRRFILGTITVILTLIAIDLMLHAAGAISPRLDELMSTLSARQVDDKLGYRPNPKYPDHDTRGFRNPVALDTSYIVALGDSHTYGSGVESNQAWPRVLESSLSQKTVYNMGFGGYGPAHSLILWDEAKALKPKIIIEGFYSGNDLHDSFSLVYNLAKLSELKTDDHADREIIIQAESAQPIHRVVSKMYKRGRTNSTRLKIKAWFMENSKISKLLHRAQYELSGYRSAKKAKRTDEEVWQKAQSFAAKHSEYAQEFSSENSRTIFTSEYRLSALNLDDPRIEEGKQISFKAIYRMNELAQQDDIRYIVLLIPTKEMVFAAQAKNLDSASYHELIKNERLLWKQTKRFLQESSIEYIDPLKALQLELASGNQPYQMSHDGHPNKAGQAIIAAITHSYLNAK